VFKFSPRTTTGTKQQPIVVAFNRCNIMRKSSPKEDGAGRTDDSKKKKDDQMASVSETMSFVFACGFRVRLFFVVGCIAGFGNGLVFPVLAYVMSSSFSSLSGAAASLDDIKSQAYMFMIVGVYALVAAFFQTGCLEIVAFHASRSFRLQWFKALLRQDTAFFDVYDVTGISATIGPNSKKFQRGLGSKFGEGIQFGTTFVFGIIYAFWASWQVAFVVLSFLPLVSLSAIAVVNINKSKGATAAAAYSKAGSVAYNTISAIKTVLSLNAIPEMIHQYSEATFEAYEKSIGLLWKAGFANGRS
jgi:ATP-binding cassette subfamily B (MDR/TAP) protein 1